MHEVRQRKLGHHRDQNADVDAVSICWSWFGFGRRRGAGALPSRWNVILSNVPTAVSKYSMAGLRGTGRWFRNLAAPRFSRYNASAAVP
jgi:hypothetical protein